MRAWQELFASAGAEILRATSRPFRRGFPAGDVPISVARDRPCQGVIGNSTKNVVCSPAEETKPALPWRNRSVSSLTL